MKLLSHRLKIMALNLLWVAGLMISPWLGQAAVLVPADTYDLQPNTANQSITLNFTTDAKGTLAGLEFNLQVGDGGPELSGAGGSVDGPTITRVELDTGTPFEGTSANVTQSIDLPQLQAVSVDLQLGGVTPGLGVQTLLATITLDTTGFHTVGQSWDLKLNSTLNGNSHFIADSLSAGPVAISAADSLLQIVATPVPEITSAPILMAIAIGFATFSRTRK